jgi:hypothetical protein
VDLQGPRVPGEAYEIKGREQAEATAMMLGRVSYEAFAPVWPGMEDFAEYRQMLTLVESESYDQGSPG